MKKILPVNSDPFLRTYTHHGFLNAILGADDKVSCTSEDSVAEVYVHDYKKYLWQNQNDQLDYSVDASGKIVFTSNRWNIGMNMAFWRECDDYDRLSLNIEKQLYCNAWSSITVFLTDNTDCKMTDINSYPIYIGNFAKDGIYYSIEKGIHNRLNKGFMHDIQISLSREGDEIYFEYEGAVESEEKLVSGRMHIFHLEKKADYKIGFAINLGNSAYYEWMFSNYIQLFARPFDGIPLDYIVNPHKDWCIYTTNPLMDYHRIKKSDLSHLNLREIDYIKMQLELNNYIEIVYNDNIHLGDSDEEEGKDFHQNLIYGYDDKENEFYAFFYDEGRIVESRISYDDYESERNQGGSEYLYMMKYNPCSEYFGLFRNRILQLFKEYKNSENISLYETFYLDGFMFGLSCYEYYAVGEGADYAANDVRIAYLLYEKTICNIDRVQYLYAREELSEKAKNQLVDMLQPQADVLNIIISLIMQKSFGRHIDEDRIKGYLREALNLEEKYIDQMINCLEDNN